METKQFKLAALLKLRENKEKVAQRELGEQFQVQNKLMTQKTHWTDVSERLHAKAGTYIKGDLDVNQIQSLQRYHKTVVAELESVEEKLVAVEHTIEVKKEALRDALKDRKILENLKEKYQEQWINAQKVIEQQRLDEVVSYRYMISQEVKHG